MGNKYLSEVIQEHKKEILENNDFIILSAGVGAGKNTWVQKDLVKELKDNETILFITSRKMIQQQSLKEKSFCDNFKMCKENHYHFTTTYQKLIKMIINEEDIFENIKQLESLNFKYIIVDEIHSMIADSGFADSTFYFTMLINYFSTIGKKIICMSGTASSLKSYFVRFGDYKQFDFTDECYNVKPKSVEIITSAKAFKLLSQANSNNKMLYMANSATAICKNYLPNLIKNYSVKPENIGILINDTKRNDLMSRSNDNVKQILKDMDLLQEHIVKNETFPDNINVILASSKIREGINLVDSNIKAMFCESHNPIDIIQFSGRYRKNIEKYYIIDDSYNQVKDDTIMNYIVEFDFLNNSKLKFINLYHSILEYKSTNYKNHFLRKYLKLNNQTLDNLISNMIFTYAGNISFKVLNEESNRIKKLKISKATSNHSYKKSLILNNITINSISYNEELEAFKQFITNKFNFIKYNPLFDKYEIYNEKYCYLMDSYNAYLDYKENPQEFIKKVFNMESVIYDIPDTNLTEGQIKNKILELLTNKNYINVILDRNTQKEILDTINNSHDIILNKIYSQLGRLLNVYNIPFIKPGAHSKGLMLIQNNQK